MKHGFSTYTNLLPLLSTSAHTKNLLLASSLHAVILKHTTFTTPFLVPHNSLITTYSRCGDLSSAVKLFHHMHHKDTVSWNSLLSAHFHNLGPTAGVRFFRDAVFPRCDHATFTTVLAASVGYGPELVQMLHSVVVSCGYVLEISVGNALMTAYFRTGCGVAARKVFDEMPERNVITWTGMLSGLQQSGGFVDSLKFFKEMRVEAIPANSLTYSTALLACGGARGVEEGKQVHALALKAGVDSDSCVESATMDMYSKCGEVANAQRVFETAEEEPDKVSHTVVLSGYARNGMEEEAFAFFVRMLRKGVEVDADVAAAVLGAFGGAAQFSLGKQMHSLVVRKRLGSNLFVVNGLINMYSKCGDLDCAVAVFDETVSRNAVTWNSMINAFARHGRTPEALRAYERMREEAVEPTDVTFLSLLHACSHVGDVEKGMDYFTAMAEVYGISPRAEHYACVVDMFGRAARLGEAKAFVESLPLPSQQNALVWQSLLGACGIYGDMEVGRYAAERLIHVEPGCAAAYVLLANICSSKGAWKERAVVIGKMREMGVRKDTGISWIEVAGEVHRFVVRDDEHSDVKMIYEALGRLSLLCRTKNVIQRT